MLVAVVAWLVLGGPVRAESGFIGMQVQPATAEARDALGGIEPLPGGDGAGVLVLDLLPWGPAGRAGVRRGDLVRAWEGQPVRDLRAIVALAGKTAPGDRLDLEVVREGRLHRVGLTLAAWPPGWRLAGGETGTETRLGLTVAPLSGELRRRLDVRWGATGLMVMDLEADSPGVRAGLAPGAIIVAVGGQGVVQPGDLWAHLVGQGASAEAGWVPLLVQDGGGFHLLALPLDRRAPSGPRPLVSGSGLRVGQLADGTLLVVDVARLGVPELLARGAVITAIGGRAPDPNLLRAAEGPLELEVRRDDGTAMVRLDPTAASPPPGERRDLPGLGLTVADRSPEVETRMGLRWGVRGVVVQGVAEAGPADGRLLPGDTLVALNQRPLPTVEALVDRLDAARAAGAGEVLLLVENVYGYRHVVLAVGGVGGPALAPLLDLE